MPCAPRESNSRDHSPHVRPRHLRPALRPGRAAALRRARRRAPARRDQRAGGQAATTPSSAGSPGRRCACSTTCGSRTAGWTPRPDRRGRRHAARRAQPQRPVGAAGRVPQRQQRQPDPGRRAQPRAEGRDVCLVTKDVPLRVKAAAIGLDTDEYRAHGRRRRRLDRHGRARRWTTPTSTRCTTPARPSSRRPPSCRRTPGWCCCPRAGRRWAGSRRTSRCGWCAATARRSGCTAARPSSASRSTCCSTPRSASSRSAAGPAPASRRWRCAPAWSR